ncbi:hypothetical protein [Dysgonomonas sp. 511]|uniref:hypothetical protein n=1 Tax=Dysgonomonas sp. 511 TaxID=2302930 RepID=UPI0013D15505|nr:hypothetical protein [Dysgonomonas sp. 511]NDV79008.1 hypothetical protein [Dysgonomonas sp. 511]
MKTRLCKFLLVSFIAVAGFSFAGCGDDITEEHYWTGADTHSVDFTVEADAWDFNEVKERYEYEFAFKELDADVFNDGAVLGYIYVQEGGVLKQKVLPYLQTYYEDGEIYTENIGFELSLNPKKILFYIQSSDLGGVYLPTYKFKTTLIWRIE